MKDSRLDVCFRHRSTFLLLLAYPVLYWTLAASVHASILESAFGAFVVCSGVLLRLRAVRHIGRGARVARADVRGGLLQSGPYRWSRNPLYLAAALMLCGFGLMAGGDPWALLLAPAVLLAYTPVVAAEERALGAILGEPYAHYRASVPRWVGAPRLARTAPAADLVPWREVLSRETWLLPGSAVGALAVWVIGSWTLEIPPTLLGGVWLAVALWNSVHIERKWRRRRRRRELARRSESPTSESGEVPLASWEREPGAA